MCWGVGGEERCGRVSGEVCWGVEKVRKNVGVWERVWGEWGSVLGMEKVRKNVGVWGFLPHPNTLSCHLSPYLPSHSLTPQHTFPHLSPHFLTSPPHLFLHLRLLPTHFPTTIPTSSLVPSQSVTKLLCHEVSMAKFLASFCITEVGHLVI